MVLIPFFNPGRVWRTGAFPAPWDKSRPSIHATLLAAREAGRRLGEAELPDEDVVNAASRLRFVAGATDNILGRPTQEGAAPVVAAVLAVLRRPDARAVARLYALATNNLVIAIIDEVLIRLGREAGLDAAKFEAFFAWLARNAPDREPVKLALAMLGRVSDGRHADLFLLMGAHEEFTKYAAVALRTTLPPSEARAALEALAREVRGWGRIDLVHRLADEGADETFRRWLVREGFRTEVVDEYLAHTAAMAGDLLGQLRAPGAAEDQALLDGAAGIFAALVSGGPAQDMSDYAQGAEAALAWLALLDGRTPTLKQAVGLSQLLRHAEGRLRIGRTSIWAGEEAAEVGRRARALLTAPATTARIVEALRQGGLNDYWAARAAAPEAGIDLWPFAFARQAAGDDKRLRGHWFDLMRTEDEGRVDRVLDLALRQLPLDEVASGPADEMGLGLAWAPHQAIDAIVQGLRAFPGKGWPFLAAALRSPVIRNRNMAIQALEAWGPERWPPEAMPILHRALDEEPRDDVRAKLNALVQKSWMLVKNSDPPRP